MGHVPLFSSERLRFRPSSGIYSFLIFSFLLVLLLLFSLHWLFLYWCYLVLIVVDLVSKTIDLFAVVVLCCGCCVPSCWYWCSVCLVMVWLVAFLVSWGVWVLLFFCPVCHMGWYVVLLVDGCVASVVFIRCIPDLGVGVSSSIVLFSVVLFLIMLLGVVLFFCCFYLLRMSSLISLMFFFFFSFWFSWFFFLMWWCLFSDFWWGVFSIFLSFWFWSSFLFLNPLFMLAYRRGRRGELFFPVFPV